MLVTMIFMVCVDGLADCHLLHPAVIQVPWEWLDPLAIDLVPR